MTGPLNAPDWLDISLFRAKKHSLPSLISSRPGAGEEICFAARFQIV